MATSDKRLNTKFRNLVKALDTANRKPISDPANRQQYDLAKIELLTFVLRYQDRLGIVPVDEVQAGSSRF
jgi:hypothetical protein